MRLSLIAVAVFAALAACSPSADEATEPAEAPAALPPGQQEAMIANMVDGLDKRLQANPKDANGWIMLIRSRMTLGEPAKAKAALDAPRIRWRASARSTNVMGAT